MTTLSVEQALENIYLSLDNNNQDIDNHIVALKTAMAAKGETSVTADTTRLAQPNRQGRKMMQSYFKKRGVTVNFTEAA